MKMELPNREPNRIKDYDYSQEGSYFVTICTLDRKKILSRISVGTPLPGCPEKPRKDSGHPGTGVPTTQLLWHGKIADQFIRQMDAFYDYLSVDKYVIMPDHIHFLITIHGHPGTGVPTKGNSIIAWFVGTFKRFCNKEYGENLWQGRYYDHVIRNQQDYNEIWEYIENNPLKWALIREDTR